MRWIIFSRVSTDLQTVGMQVKECREYIANKFQEGDEIINIEEPETSSRIKMTERVKLQEMLSTVRKGDTVIVYKLDRIARDGAELVYIYRNLLVDKGVKVVSLNEPTIDNANIHIFAFVAETERNNIRVRTISGLKRKQKDMEKVGTCWYGYKTDPNKIQLHKEKCYSYGKPYLLIPCENEMKQVEIMVNMRHKGKTYDEISQELANNGFYNRKGNPVDRSTIMRVVKRLEKQGKIQDMLKSCPSHQSR